MDLNSTLFFVTVVREGSFTEAAKRLATAKSTISEKVSELEKRLGVTLLTRTTRKLKLTDVGAAYYQKAVQALASIQDAEEQASISHYTPMGTLRITAPANLVSHVILEAVVEYRKKFPNVKIELCFSDKQLDLIAEGFDIAFRPGALPDSNLIAKQVGRASRILVASPAYLKAAPPLNHPRELKNHRCVTLMNPNIENIWELRTKDGKTSKVNLIESLSTNSLPSVKDLVQEGQGIALLPNSICKQELLQKKYIWLLPEWATTEIPVYLVYPPQRYSSAKVAEMIPMIERCVRKLYQ